MQLKILMILFTCVTIIHANVKIKTKQDVRNAHKGMAYLSKQKDHNIKTVKLKRYFLAQEIKKPFIFESNDSIYNLYLTSILNKGRPVWLDDDKFVFHTSSGQKYLKWLKSVYKKKYNLETVIYKNPNYTRKVLALRDINTDDLLDYIDEKIPVSLLAKKKRKKKKVVKSKKETTPKIAKPLKRAQVHTKTDVRNVNLGLVTMKKHIQKNPDTVKLNRYFLAKIVKKPFIFSSNKPIYNLYLTSILNKGTPVWLDDDKFVLHTSSGKKYLKQLKRVYRKKYNLETVIYKNPNYRKKPLAFRDINTENLLDYIRKQTPEVLVQRLSTNTYKQGLNKQKKIARSKKLRREKRRTEKKKKRLAKEKQKKEIAQAKKRKFAEKKKRLNKQNTKQKQILATDKELTKKKIELEEQRKSEQKKRELEEEIWAEKKKKLAEERKTFEKEKARDKEQLEIRKKEVVRLKKLAQEKESAEKKRKKIEINALANKKKKLEKLKKRAAVKEKKKDTLTSDLDKMMKETSNFKEKLERSESIKYY